MDKEALQFIANQLKNPHGEKGVEVGGLMHTDFFSTRSEAESYQQMAMREIEKLLQILSAENSEKGEEYYEIIKKITS